MSIEAIKSHTQEKLVTKIDMTRVENSLKLWATSSFPSNT